MSVIHVIRGVTGKKIPCAFPFISVDEFVLNLKSQFSDLDRESIFLLTDQGLKLFDTSPVPPPSTAPGSTILVLFLRQDFSDSVSLEISDVSNFQVAMTALSRFLVRRRDSFDAAISGFSSAVEVHSQKTSEILAGLDATLGNLQKVELLPSLATPPDRKNLYDVIPHGRIAEFRTQLGRQVADILAKIRAWKLDASEVCAAMTVTATALSETTGVPNRDRSIANLIDFGQAMTAVRRTEMAGVLLEEAFARSRKSLGQLQHLEKMPLAYEKTLSEIVRRKIFKDKFLSRIEAFKKEMADMKIFENDRRKKFFNKYAIHLPSGLISGLGDSVPSVAVELTPSGEFDCELPLVIGNSSQLSSSSMEPPVAMSTRFLNPPSTEY